MVFMAWISEAKAMGCFHFRQTLTIAKDLSVRSTSNFWEIEKSRPHNGNKLPVSEIFSPACVCLQLLPRRFIRHLLVG